MVKFIFLMLIATIGMINATPELKLVHVVFSHKLQAPVETNELNETKLPEMLDYRYFLEETDDFDNARKLDMYNLGVFLREKYDTFLGDLYHPDFMEMRTTEYTLSMISGMLVDAGLWPPKGVQKWNPDLDWQPIPTDYEVADRDTLLLGYFCPSFQDDHDDLESNATDILEEHVNLFNYLTIHYGKEVKTLTDVALLYATLETMDSLRLTRPIWSGKIYPYGEMRNITLLSYDILSKTSNQRRLNGGSLLKKILLDSVDHENENGTSKKKIYMYSAEERTIVGLLQNMGLWEPHILEHGAAIIFEVYSDSLTREYTIKMSYLEGVRTSKLTPLKLTDCKDYCSLVDFASILDGILPVDEMTICQQKRPLPPPVEEEKDNGAEALQLISLPMVMIISLFLTLMR